MKVVLCGTVIALRHIETKTGFSVEVDLLQYGNKRFPSKVISVKAIPSTIGLLLDHQREFETAYVTLNCWIHDHSKGYDVHLVEIFEVSESMPDDDS